MRNLLGMVAIAAALVVFAGPAASLAGGPPTHGQASDSGCATIGGYTSCWQAHTSWHQIFTLSGNGIYGYENTNHWTYYDASGNVYGTSHGTYNWFANAGGAAVYHEIDMGAVRFGPLSCHAVFTIQVVNGEVRHKVDTWPCVPA
jgi:hypothetical protein